MRLTALLGAVPQILQHPLADPDVTGLTMDSRQVRPGFLFVAVPGLSVDGHRFIPQALAAGAAALVGTRPVAELALPAATPYVQVADARAAFGWLSAAWRDFPSRKLTLIGVTGTDGKTTTTNLIYGMLQAAGFNAGMVSTVNAEIGGRSYDTGLHTTTPEADAVQAYLAEMVSVGATHAVLESTSHGLAQHRLTGCDFDVAVVTNITHEHLDYHGTYEAYREAKASLFRRLMTSYRKGDTAPKVAVLNADDPGSYAHLRTIPADWQIVYGLDAAEADVTATDIVYAPDGLRFRLHSPWGQAELWSPLVGAFNVSNLLAAASVALALGVTPAHAAAGARAVRGIPGRMERIDLGQPFTAVVDFAHTPNALQRALEAARALIAPGARVIVAFGCAGLRDREKRRLMGAAAAAFADVTIVTAEDPRTEDLDAIIAETARALEVAGRREGVDFYRVPDRGAALLQAVTLAQPGDIVLACGKGHEQSMCFGTQEYPWDDREALRCALQGQALRTLPTSER